MTNIYQAGIDSRSGPLEPDTDYGVIESIFKSQLETYHYNKPIADVLQRRLPLLKRRDFLARSGISYSDSRLDVEVNSNPALWKLGHLVHPQPHHQWQTFARQHVDALQLRMHSQMSCSRGTNRQPSEQQPTLSSVPHVWIPRNDHPGAVVHYFEQNHAGLLQHASHPHGMNRGDKRSATEASLAHRCTNTDERYFGTANKRPRLNQEIPPVPVHTRTPFVEQCHLSATSYGAYALRAIPEGSFMGRLPLSQPKDNEYVVPPHSSLPHLARTNTSSANLCKNLHHESNASYRVQKDAVPVSLSNLHPLLRHDGCTSQHRSQRPPASMKSARFPSGNNINVRPTLVNRKHGLPSLRFSPKADHHAPFVVSKEGARDHREDVTVYNGSAKSNGLTCKCCQNNILLKALTHRQMPDLNRRNASRHLSNGGNVCHPKVIRPILPKPAIRRKMVQKMPSTMTPMRVRNQQMGRGADDQHPLTGSNLNGNRIYNTKTSQTTMNDIIFKAGQRLPIVEHMTSRNERKSHGSKNVNHNHFSEGSEKEHKSILSIVTTQKCTSDDFKSHDDRLNRMSILSKIEDGAQAEDSLSKNTLETEEGLKMSCGTFLRELVVPVTLAISNNQGKSQKLLKSVLELWQRQRQLLTFDGNSEGEELFSKGGMKVEEEGKTKETEQTTKDFVGDLNGKTRVVGGEIYSSGSKAPFVPEKGGSDTIYLDETADNSQSDVMTDEANLMSAGGDNEQSQTGESPERDFHGETSKAEDDNGQLTLRREILCKTKSVRVVLKSSDRIKMKFYNVYGATDALRCTRRGKRSKNCTTEKKIMMRIGSERLFTRSYRSEIPSKKTPQVKPKRKYQRKKKETSISKELRRIALSVRKTSGETILHKIVRLGARDVLKHCLDHRCHNGVNVTDNAGYTPLHECCVYGRLWIAEQLITNGADVNASAQDGTRPLHDAVENGYIELVRLLLIHGADPLIPTYAKLTALDNAKSVAMRLLLSDYVRDTNGASEELAKKLKLSSSTGSTIRFRTSYGMEGTESWESMFLDTSSFDGAGSGPVSNPIMYLKESPPPDHFRLQLKEDERVKTWYLLLDVLSRLKIPAMTFPYLYPHIKVHGLPTDIFIKKVKRANCKLQRHHMEMCASREVIEFVEADEDISAILQLEGWTC